ncbi:MAG: maleylpyruvate isomerase N-terminal domain-containing protein, partial [Chloroflexi bacterium]|nr:maleylpyruvate isomerase N-terminal domain-containing protein [Chloroflexota bacterium]
MRPIVEALAAQDAELEGLLAELDRSGWTLATPCEGWDVADVVIHVAQTNEFAVACIDGQASGGLVASGSSTADEAAALAVAADRGQPPEAIFERWRTSARAQRDALEACDPSRRVPWVIGELPARTLATTRLSETWIHTTDVARAVGAPVELSDRMWSVARLAWRTLPYAFARA